MTPPKAIETTPPVEKAGEVEPTVEKKPRRLKWYLLGILIVILGAALGGLLGYNAGQNLRLQAEQDQKVMVATNQYQLGLLDMEAGRYEMARKRFEFVINTDPNFPGAADQLAKAMLEISLALTPTPEPTPTLAPTPDLRTEQEMFAQIEQSLVNQDWAGAIASIEALRNLNFEYRAVDVDGMYYIALRYLGVEDILNRGELEVGIYNLTLAERFAPLDVDAINYRNWARQYIAAASFWKIDWPRVIEYFAQIYPALPNLRDASGLTATERYRQALIGYGDQLVLESKYCEAQVQYEAALEFGNFPDVQAKVNSATEFCANAGSSGGESQPQAPTPTPTQPVDATPTETPPETGNETQVPPTESTPGANP